ncbi:MAG: peptidoglycan editing factor PgeF [Polynucleobacter sp.]|nr:peptidoglycan editing factor PgeF [Polynucleobacter sp.]MDZ4056368.1 peptidoglycan editing factor PgeF [Polynucleobacter sp.]
MSIIQTHAGLTLIAPDWPAPSRIGAVCTTRMGGVSKAPFDSLNLGQYVNDEPTAVIENRLRVQAVLPSEPVWLRQVHGSRVWDTDSKTCPEGPIEADASVTNQPNRVLAVMAADCLPVLFASSDGQVVGAAHAGWKGLLAGVLENTVDAMQAKSDSKLDLMAWLGPAIGPNAFEVGEDVRAAYEDCAVRNGAPLPLNAFTAVDGKAGKYWADLYQLARHRLSSKGISAIYGGEFCTVHDQKLFFSYRRDGVCGRFASLIWLH